MHNRRATVALLALFLAGLAGGCDDDGGTGGEAGGLGGTGGNGGLGGPGQPGVGGYAGEDFDACPSEERVRANVTYTNDNGSFVGVEALTAMSSDCLCGNAPFLTPAGCALEVSQVLADATLLTRAELTNCLGRCMVEQSADVLGLPAGCPFCFGEERTCAIASCADPCEAGLGCEACLCSAGCPDQFWNCSGFVSATRCEEARP
ncbi:MAG: hypothetical protein WBG86_08335 [Polyangiales bacterium]